MKFDTIRAKSISGMVLRYGISGFSGIGANLIVFTLLLEYTDAWLALASFLGFIAAYVVTFLMHKYWTFRNMSKELFYKQSIVYFFSSVATLLINTTVLYVLVAFGSFPPVFAQFLSLLFAAFLSFLFTTQVTFHVNASRIHFTTSFLKPEVWSRLWQQKAWLAVLTLVMCICVFLRVTVFPLTFTSDAVSYIATAQLLFGDETAAVYGERILKPMAPAVVGLISQTGIAPAFALLLQSILLYFVLGWSVFWLGFELFRKPGHAFALSLIVVTSYPIFRYGINYYTETGIWALYFATLAATLRWTIKPSFPMLWVVSMLLLIGLLWKEYAVLAGLVFGLAILFQTKFSWTGKVYAIIQTGLLVLLPWGIWQYAVFHIYDYSYIDWLAVGSSPSAYTSEYMLLQIVKTTFALLFLVWFLVPYGAYKWREIPEPTRKMLLLMFVPSFGFLLWGYVSSRLFFSLVPLVAPLAVVGFMALPGTRFKIVVALLIVVVNSILVALAFDPNIRMILNHLS